MGLFDSLVRSGADDIREPVKSSPKLPTRFDAVGEALVTGGPLEAACEAVGRDLAQDGGDLEEALDGLRSTYLTVTGREPDFHAIRALCAAWSEETLGYLHQVSCENPLTGLASTAHLRARLAEVQRGAERDGRSASASYALVIVDLPDADPSPARSGAATPDLDAHFSRALEIARVADRVWMVFDGEETIAQIGPRRLLVLTERTPELPGHVVMVRGLLDEIVLGSRVWIEGLPTSSAGIAAQLSELARARRSM